MYVCVCVCVYSSGEKNLAIYFWKGQRNSRN